MKKEAKNLVKKKNFWITLVNNSIGIQIMICVTVILLLIVGNYILSRFEYEYLGWSAGTLGRLVRISILMIGNLIAELFVILFFSSIPDWIHKLIAIRKYCYLPMTEYEARENHFENAGEYFQYVQNSICTDKKQWVILSAKDFYQMIMVCLKLFPDKGTLFELQSDDCRACPLSFYEFIENYTKEKVTLNECVKISEEGEVQLSYAYVECDNGGIQKMRSLSVNEKRVIEMPETCNM